MSTAVSQVKDERAQYSSLKAELARLSSLIEAAKKRLESYQFDTAEADRVGSLLAELKKKKSALEADIRTATAQKKSKDRELGRIDTRLKVLKTKLDELEGVRGVEESKRKTLRDECAQLKKDKAALLENSRESRRVALQEISKKIADAADHLRDLNGEIDTKRKRLQHMDTTLSEEKALVARMKTRILSIENLDKEIAFREKILEGKKREIAGADVSMSTKREAHDAAIAKDWVDIRLARKDLEDREGQVNFLLNNLKDKAGLLKQAKQELEAFHGKQLRHIIIPIIEIQE